MHKQAGDLSGSQIWHHYEMVHIVALGLWDIKKHSNAIWAGLSLWSAMILVHNFLYLSRIALTSVVGGGPSAVRYKKNWNGAIV